MNISKSIKTWEEISNSLKNLKKKTTKFIENKGKKFKINIGTSGDRLIKSSKNKIEDFKESLKTTGKYIEGKTENIKESVGKGLKYIGNKTHNFINPEKNNNINIKKIKEIPNLVKNDYIYINITNLIGADNYELTGNKKKYFTTDKLLNMIVYLLISNNKDSKNIILFFIKKNYLYIYDVKNNNQYIKNIK